MKRFLLSLLGAVCFLLPSSSHLLFAQCGSYDVTTQPKQTLSFIPGSSSNPSWISSATSNIGTFLTTGGTQVKLVGNSGSVISSGGAMNNLNEVITSNIAVATNHNSTLAIISSSDRRREGKDFFHDENNNPIEKDKYRAFLLIRILDNQSNNDLTNPNTNKLGMEKPNIVELSPEPPITDSIELSDDADASEFGSDGDYDADGDYDYGIYHIEAQMDKNYLYITFQDQYRKMFFAVMRLSDHYLFIDNSDITHPKRYFPITHPNMEVNRKTAVGWSFPTVACNRWNSAAGAATFAFVYRTTTGSYQAAQFGINISGNNLNIGTSQNIPHPPGPGNLNCNWIRVADADDQFNTNQRQFFYAFDGSDVNHWTLYWTNGQSGVGNLSSLITGSLLKQVNTGAYHFDLAFIAFAEGHIPAPAAGDGYNGNNSVYCAYAERIGSGQITLNICREGGLDNCVIHTGLHPVGWTLGINQMGIYSFFTDAVGPTFKLWRSFRVIRNDIIENTVASGLVHVSSPNDPSTRYIRVGLGDSLRVLAGGTLQEFRYVANTGGNGLAASVAAGLPVTTTTLPSVPTKRAHIILDNNANVNFNHLATAEMLAQGYGSIQYDGSILKNMNQNLFGAQGYVGVISSDPTTLENSRGFVNINATCAIFNGSTFVSSRGHVWFKEANTQTDMKVLTCNGTNTSIDITGTSIITFGSTNNSTALTQIITNGDPIVSPGQVVRIKNSTIQTRVQQPDVTFPPAGGFRADLVMNRPQEVDIDGNKFQYAGIVLNNPGPTINIKNSDFFMIEKGIDVTWDPPSGQGYSSPYNGSLLIQLNTFKQNWPFGAGTDNDNLVDIAVHGFDVSDLSTVVLDRNDFVNGAFTTMLPVWHPNYTGILFDDGSQGKITNNTIHDHGIGIHTIGILNTNPFLCSNYITRINYCCRGTTIGVYQDNCVGLSTLNEISNLDVGFLGTNYDQSTLIGNDIYDCNYGTKFTTSAKTRLHGAHSGTHQTPGFNTIHDNLTYQVEIECDPNNGNVPVPNPEFGQSLSANDPNEYGQNEFLSTGSAKHMHYTYTGPGPGTVASMTLAWPITANKWNPNITAIAGNTWIPGTGTGSDPEIIGIRHLNAVNGSVAIPEISCDAGTAIFRSSGKNLHTLSVAATPVGDGSPENGDSLYLYNRAMGYDNVEPKKGLDTMRLYCERHPFAMEFPGQTIDALLMTNTFTAQLDRNKYIDAWPEQYNWLIRMQPVNLQPMYQTVVLRQIANAMYQMDRNRAANLWYNYTLWNTDSAYCANAWAEIAKIRKYQGYRHEDTTAFTLLHLPLTPVADVKVPIAISNTRGSLELSISPNPAGVHSVITYVVPSGAAVRLALFDALGKEIQVISQGYKEKGQYNYSLVTKDLAEGAYFLRYSSGGELLSKRLVIKH